MKAFFTYDYGQEKMDSIRAMGYEIVYTYEKEAMVDEKTKDAEILVCYNPFTTLDIGQMTNLKWIQLSSIGIDQVPIDKIKDRGIILTNNRGGYSIPMGEWIVLKALEMIKESRRFYEQQEERKWKINTEILELYKKTIGFIGTGSIAVEAAKRLQGFGMDVLGLNTTGRDIEYFTRCYPMEKMHEVLGLCDIVVLTIPYTEKTHHLVNEAAFQAMQDNVYMINVSRGSIIDEKAMMKYLENGKIKGAALDVFEEEPLPPNHPLWQYKNVLVTPHNSWISEMRNERRFEMIYENLRRYAHGERLLNVIDTTKGY